jgi:dolichol-phosphate mannosyltransferase
MQLGRFLVVGTSGYVVNLAIFSIALLLGAHYIPAAILAFIVAWMNNFMLNRYWTFRAHAEAMVGQGARYLAVSVVALIANLIILQLLVDAGLGETLSQAIAIVLVTPLSYLLSRCWSFR